MALLSAAESKGRFLVNNILMFGSTWFLAMVQVQFSLMKKIKIEHPQHPLPLKKHKAYIDFGKIFVLH